MTLVPKERAPVSTALYARPKPKVGPRPCINGMPKDAPRESAPARPSAKPKAQCPPGYREIEWPPRLAEGPPRGVPAPTSRAMTPVLGGMGPGLDVPRTPPAPLAPPERPARPFGSPPPGAVLLDSVPIPLPLAEVISRGTQDPSSITQKDVDVLRAFEAAASGTQLPITGGGFACEHGMREMSVPARSRKKRTSSPRTASVPPSVAPIPEDRPVDAWNPSREEVAALEVKLNEEERLAAAAAKAAVAKEDERFAQVLHAQEQARNAKPIPGSALAATRGRSPARGADRSPHDTYSRLDALPDPAPQPAGGSASEQSGLKGIPLVRNMGGFTRPGEGLSDAEHAAWYKAESSEQRRVTFMQLCDEPEPAFLRCRSLTPFGRTELPMPGPRHLAGPTFWGTPERAAVHEWHMAWTDAEISSLGYVVRRRYKYQWTSALDLVEYFSPATKQRPRSTRGPTGRWHSAEKRGPTRDGTSREHEPLTFERLLALMWYDQPMPRCQGHRGAWSAGHACHAKRFAINIATCEPAGIYLRALGDHDGLPRGREQDGTAHMMRPLREQFGLVPIEEAWARDLSTTWTVASVIAHSAWLRQQHVLRILLRGGTPQDILFAPTPALNRRGRGGAW